MSPIIAWKNILHLNYLFALIISIILSFILYDCGDIGCLAFPIFGLGVFMACVLVTSGIFFFAGSNRYVSRRELLYYYIPFLVILGMSIQNATAYASLFAHILPSNVLGEIFLIPLVVTSIPFLISSGSFYLISRFPSLRKSLPLNTFLTLILMMVLGTAASEVLYTLACLTPDLYCQGESFPIIEQ